jgi:OmpA-OmpF porin, OOP family
MASKKYTLLLAGLLSLSTFSATQAQTGSTNVYKGSGVDVLDTSLIPSRRMDQQRDFLNRNYDYPAKPRNQWELGLSVGALNVSGDVRSKNIFNRPQKAMNTLGYAVSIRKAWGYIISTRLQYMRGNASGYNWQTSEGWRGHMGNPYAAGFGEVRDGAGNITTAGTTPYLNNQNVRYSYKTNIQELSLQMLAALNNIKFHRARNKMSTYGMFGVGGLLYETRNDAYDANNAQYVWPSKAVGNNGSWFNHYQDRKNIDNLLLAMFDNNYESRAERHDNRAWRGEKTFRPIATTGLGMSFRLGKRISLNIEDKVTFTMDDLIDGQRWQEPGVVITNPNGTGANGYQVTSAMTRDYDNINYLSLGLGINLGGKSVAPLWWLNPMDYTYSELTNPRHLKVGGGDCDKDADGDGVSDCFDKCPDTEAGVAVDTKGCCLDTDGDGVCDSRDKQLITPTECQPVDADGVGKCPCNCPDRGIEPISCGTIGNGSIMFAPAATTLSGASKSQLSSLAAAMRANPSCKVVITGNGAGSKLAQQRSWARANAVINHMSNVENIDRDRFIFNYGGSNGDNTVDYRSAGENEMGSSSVPPPHPNLR